MGVKTRQGLKRKTKFHLHLGVIVKRLVFPTDADFFFFLSSTVYVMRHGKVME